MWLILFNHSFNILNSNKKIPTSDILFQVMQAAIYGPNSNLSYHKTPPTFSS